MSETKTTEYILIALIAVSLIVSGLSYTSISPIAKNTKDLADSIEDIDDVISDLSTSMDAILTKLGEPDEPYEADESEEGMKRVLRSTWSFPTFVDPHYHTDRSSGAAQANLYDPIIKLGSAGEPVPWVAESWTSSDDGLVYTFTIKRGIKFHDGTELTTEDVVFSINRQLTMGTGVAYVLLPHVYNATIIDENKFQLNMKHTFGPLISTLNNWYIVNKDIVMEHIQEGQHGEYGDFGNQWLMLNDAGSGPYMLKEVFLEEKLVFEKFEDYWKGFNSKAPDIIEMLNACEPITVRLLLSNRNLEYADPWQTYESLLKIKEIPNTYIASTIATWGNYQIMMNTKKAPLDDVHVRRALAYAMDYELVCSTLFPGTVKCQGPINQAMAGFDPTVTAQVYDMDMARQEIALSKYADTIGDYELDLYWSADVKDQEKVCIMLQAEAYKLGIKINVLKTFWTKIVADCSMLETSPHLAYIGAGSPFPEAGGYILNRYHSSTANSWTQNEWLLNETFDALIEDSLMALDYDERMEQYSVMQHELVRLCPTMWLYAAVSNYGFPDYVTPNWVSDGEYLKSSELGDVYLNPMRGSGADDQWRLWEVDRLIKYED